MNRQIWLNPQGESASLADVVASRLPRLEAAAAEGKRFLALPVDDPHEALSWILASFHSSLAVVPFSHQLPAPVQAALLAQLPAGSVAFPASLPEGKKMPYKLKSLQEIWAIVFTSGSTGHPKGVALSGECLAAAAQAHASHSQAHSFTWLLDLPLYHVGGLSIVARAHFLGTPLALGGQRFSALETAAWIKSGLVQGISMVPTTLFRLLQLPELNFTPLRCLLLGGAAANAELVDRALARGAPVRLTYGMTEHASQIATEKTNRSGLEPLPGVALRFAPSGELLVQSPCLAAGTYQSGDFVALPRVDGFFPTGDIAELQNGKLLVHGRLTEVIVSGGVKIFPLEVESELARLSGVQECALTSVPDLEWGEAACALVVVAPGLPLAVLEWKTNLAKILDPRKIPKHWFVVNEIPRTTSGKPLRAEIRALAQRLIANRN